MQHLTIHTNLVSISTFNFESLLFFQCYDDEFGCNDGACLSFDKRCDGAQDCSDHFDETNCKLVNIDETLYHKEFPPLKKGGIKADVNVSMDILSISSFDELGMTFEITFHLQLLW